MPFAKEAFSEEAFCASSSSSEDWCACEREAAGEKSWCEERERERGGDIVSVVGRESVMRVTR